MASAPRYVNQHWITDNSGKQTPVNCTGKDCAYCGDAVPAKEKIDKTAKWGWIVIDREDGEVKMFTGPTLIARSIKELSELVDKKSGKPVWGNPLTFDIQIERTEEPGKSYYKVAPMPEGMGTELTAEEIKAVAECGIDLATELQSSKESKHVGAYGASELETAPEEEITIPDDLGEEGGKRTEEEMPF